MGYDLRYPNLLLYIFAQVYPQNDIILEDIVQEYNSLEGSVSFLYCMKFCGGLNMRTIPLTVCL